MIDRVLEDESIILRPTVVEVNLAALRHNIALVRERVGTAGIMATVKANAYGHGLVRTSKEMLRLGVDQLGVAFLEEGVALRKAGIDAPILVMGGIIGNQISHFLEYDLLITASSVFKLRQIEDTAADMGRRARVHLKLDTGMGRIGIRSENAHTLFSEAVRMKHCDIVGVYSHLAASHDSDRSFTELQLARFLEALEFFPKNGHAMPMRHIANSGAVVQYPEAALDMVRPGIMLYGVFPAEKMDSPIPLRPVLSFKTRVVFFKAVPGGTPVGYDHTWTAGRATRIVTLPVGYGDGYSRALSNQAQVLIHGKRYPIVGRISMDQCMVDIGMDSAYNGDEVILIGSQGQETVTVEELARIVGTIPYEILTALAARVPRTYIDGASGAV